MKRLRGLREVPCNVGNVERTTCREVLEKTTRWTSKKIYQLNDDGIMLFKNRKYVHNAVDLRYIFMNEFHKRYYISHHGYHKMITAIKKAYYEL